MTKKLAKKERFVNLPRAVQRLFPNVVLCVDSDTAVDVIVSKSDCRDAKKLNPSECALAKAAKRELHADGVIIGLSSSYIIKGDTAVRFNTPQAVQREIVSFDRHQDFSPGEYTLNPKAPTQKLGSQHYRVRENRSNSNKKVHRKIHRSARVRVLPTGNK